MSLHCGIRTVPTLSYPWLSDRGPIEAVDGTPAALLSPHHTHGYRTVDPLKQGISEPPSAKPKSHTHGYRTVDPLKRAQVDQPSAALIRDLKQWGLLDS